MKNTLNAISFSLIMSVAVGLLPTVEPESFTDPMADPVQRDTPRVEIPALKLKEERKFPGVFVQDEQGKPTPLEITNLDVDVEVTGTMSVTTLDMTVYNPHRRVLEGEFSFPLNDGQTVARFALDINGKLREAVVVSKSKGRETFEEVIRTKIDPALLEWTRDNSFKTRIYPIPDLGTRRVVIAYEQELTPETDGLNYIIPFAFPDPIKEFTFNCKVAGFGLRPSLTGGDGEKIMFSPKGRDFTFKMQRSGERIDRPFAINVPVSLDETLVTVNEFDGEQYFGAFIPSAVELRSPPMPRSVTVLWDASLSGMNRDHVAELTALDAFFEKIGACDLRLITFSNAIREDISIRVSRGQWKQARQFARKTSYDGATQLGIVPFEQDADMVILVSDGISTFGHHVPQLGGVPVHVLSTAVPADHDILRMIAERSGGSLIALAEKSAEDVVNQLLSTKRVISNIEVIDGSVEDLRPQGNIEVKSITTITGKVTTGSAVLRVTSSIGGLDEQEQEIYINAPQHKQEGNSIARLWAGYELQRLNADRKRNADLIEAHGKKFNLVTPGTSLLVLERLRDYVRFNIEPPASEPALLAQFKKQRTRLVTDSAALFAGHMAKVNRMLTQRRSFLSRTVNADSLYSAYVFERKKKEEALAVQRKLRAERLRRASSDDAIVQYERVEDLAEAYEEAALAEDEDGGTFQAFGDGGSMANTTGNIQVADELHIRTDMGTSRLMKGANAARTTSAGSDGSDFVVRASRTTETQVLVDGLEVTDQFTGGLGSPNPPASRNPTDKRITLAQKSDQEAWTDKLTTAASKEIYRLYLEMRPKYHTVTAYYLDVSDMLRDIGEKELALRVLSNLAELKGEDHRDLRILGHRLLQLHQADLAALVFEDVQRIRDEEPQSYRDLALAYEAAGKPNKAAAEFMHIIEKPWHTRFPEIELIAAMELSKLVARVGDQVDKSKINDKYLVPVGVDMRVVLSWDADNCDMDLWVIDPLGETCKYNNRDTRLGGHLSRDLTGGYGPEEFILPNAAKGEYKIKVHYYGNRQQNLVRPTTVQVNMFTNYGSTDEKLEAVTLRLDGVSRVVDVASVTIE